MIRQPVRIASICRRLPARVVSNAEPPFNRLPDIAMLQQFWGIEARPVIDTAVGETEISLAVDAAAQAITLAGITPQDIDLILANTTGPQMTGVETLFPRIAHQLASALCCPLVASADIEVECASFLVQLQIACDHVASGRASHVLICSTERMSAILDSEASSSIPFGDGAVAAVVSRSTSPAFGMIDSLYFSDPTHFDLATVEWHANGDGTPAQPRFMLAAGGERALAELVPGAIPLVVQGLLERTGRRIADIDAFVFHQPSTFLHDAWVRKLKIPKDRVLCNVRTNGCLVSAALPLALHDSLRSGLVQPGQTVLFAGLGAGWAYAAQLWRLEAVATEYANEQPTPARARPARD
jgi:3-oxoacyl-(acyl-carrier-protein) synthase III